MITISLGRDHTPSTLDDQTLKTYSPADKLE